jgi:hypothetical protein
MLYLVYTITVLVCWSITRRLFLGILLAVPVDIAPYGLFQAVM